MSGIYDDLRKALAAGGNAEAEEFRAKKLVENAAEARENGYDFCCSACGVGIYDNSDEHESWCPAALPSEQSGERA